MTREITVQDGATVTQNFTLELDIVGLGEVFVTGALSERARGRSEVAVGRINAEELAERVRYQDISQLIAGKVPGVNIQTASGNVGGGVRFNMRSGASFGGGTPLIIIDGIRIDSGQYYGFGVGGQNLSALATMNPSDIENIDILKGPAAAALYGTDAANGVVIITTRRGQLAAAGQTNLALTYSGTMGGNSQAIQYTEATAGYTVANANAGFQTGPIMEHVIGASGGSSAVRFFGQYTHRDEEGILPGNYLERRSFRANFDAYPYDNLVISASAGYSLNSVARPQNDNNIQGYLGNVLLLPIPYDFTDSLAVFAFNDLTRTNQYTGSFEVRYDPIPDLTLRAQAGIDMADIRQDQTFPQGFSYPGGAGTLGQRNVFTRENDQVSFQVDARYRYDIIPELRATSSVGVQGFDRRNRTLNFAIRDFPSDMITEVGAGVAFQSTGEFFINERQIGVLFDQSLDYDDTYLLGFGGRYDMASSIAPNAPDVFYPFIRGAVLLNRFDFIPDLFTLFKPRVAYGESGILPGTFFAIPLLFGTAPGGHGGGAVPIQIGNDEIQPERVREFEFGLDVEFGDLASVEATYYIQNARNSIVLMPLAPSTGLSVTPVPYNVGAIDGSGFELGINVSPIRTQDVYLDISKIFSWQTNEVKDIGGADPMFDTWSMNVIMPGLPRAAFLVPEVRGALFDEDGVYAGVDVGGSAPDERVYLGTPYPTTNGSFSLSLTLFQDISLYTMIDYALGLKVMNMTDQFRADFGNLIEREELAVQLETLTPGTPEYIEAAHAFARTDGRFDHNFIEDGDYLKLREISLRFDVTRYVTQYTGFTALRSAALQLSGRNLWMTSRYSGPDPEVNTSGSSDTTGLPVNREGMDFLTLQQPRTFLVTLTVGL